MASDPVARRVQVSGSHASAAAAHAPGAARRRALLAALCAALLLSLASLACTANDTLFIQLTATPAPTITPTPLAEESRFAIGQTVYVVSYNPRLAVIFSALPGPIRPGEAGNISCFPGLPVTVLDIARNSRDPADETLYYQIACIRPGWAPEHNLSVFAERAPAVVDTPDDTDAALYRNADLTGPVLSVTCPEATALTILQLTTNARDARDRNLYALVQCAGQTGYILERLLVPASAD